MLARITLHLARSREFPQGSIRHGYEIIAPLDANGHLDANLWRQERAQCRVRRFWAGEPDKRGRLIHRAGGPKGATWFLDYNLDSDEDDEAGYRLGDHAFVEGEYVSIADDDDVMHTFRITSVRALDNSSVRAS
jgi:hypothetical protein